MNPVTKIGLWFVGLVVLLGLMINYLASVLMPFAVALLLAFLMNPVVNLCEKKRVPRTLAVSLIFVMLMMFFIIVLFALIPSLQKQCQYVVMQIPSFLNWINQDVSPWLEQNLSISLHIPNLAEIQQQLSGEWSNLGGAVGYVLQHLTASGMALFHVVVTLLLIPVVLFYVLRDWQQLGRSMHALLPRAYAKDIMLIWGELLQVLGAFFRGQFIVMACLGGYYALVLSISGLALGLLIGLVAGLLSVVPYLGFLGGILFALIESYLQFDAMWHYLVVLAIFAIGNALEGMVLTPVLVGDKVGLHPVAVIFCILAGGQLFGLIGILLALPVAAMMTVLLRHLFVYYHQWLEGC